MTTIITRLYSDKAAAQAVVAALRAIGIADDEVALIANGDAGDAVARMRALRVAAPVAAAHAAAVAKGRAAVIVAAPFNPRGIALRATQIADAHHPVGAVDRYIAEDYSADSTASNLYPQGTYFMSIPPAYTGSPSHAHILSFGKLVSPDRTRTSAIRGGGFMSRMVLPFPLLSRKTRSNSAIRGDWQLSKMLGIPTISGRLEF